ncbi:Uncharacterised protein [Alloiococcus otitis]|uniref:Uncharacterized protein n=1 Tax=Alloiococcus otitis ATCC 51267 TaxID=883081 RepID=K9EB98_9LACT|nr:hypothetical protein [Alloiococcus otitis]EKU93913.1 hypothetical protein HMPREF9698_00590 [Alloiococcus otitis ATCC 51267]SUU81733.1 Uncharacterised protein [Alloiococcus otitis]
MQVLLDKDFRLSGRDTQTNIKLNFTIEEAFNFLQINFTYSPGQSSDQVAQDQVKEAILKYSLTQGARDRTRLEDFLPVDNFITLSLAKDGHYLGGYHNKSKDQKILISREDASLGFWPVDHLSGQWEAQLNCHCIASKALSASLRIEGHHEA